MSTIPPRPRVTRNMILEAVLPVANKIGADAETIVEHYRHPMDGFDLAMNLSKNCFFDLTREDMEELDCIENDIRQALRDAEKKWAEENDIQSPLAIGTRISHGIITGICTHLAACYLVKENGCTRDGRSLIVKFEDAVPVSAQGGGE